jgi:hypothetical protein
MGLFASIGPLNVFVSSHVRGPKKLPFTLYVSSRY